MASFRFSLSLDAFDSKPSLHANLPFPFKTNLYSKPQLRGSKRAPKPNREHLKLTYLSRNIAPPNTDKLFWRDAEMDLSPELSTEHCNAILKRLQESENDDAKTLSFFERMRATGKLERNNGAYNVIVRLLSRREDWEGAEKLISEMKASFGSELSFHVFNTLIYACCKRNLAQLGTKWFRMMLDCGVAPNVATIGMLMGLYRKGWNLEEAEFTISQMRRFGIVCESAYSSMITIYTRFRLYERLRA
ncbi:Pentatricopeptide repeat-containing protein [Spatholobus suberectus]|nr:Pentatricopeptide repeat-containing protein [Spatholobus suberectus]